MSVTTADDADRGPSREVDVRLAVPAVGAWVAAAVCCGRSPGCSVAVAAIGLTVSAIGAAGRRFLLAALALGVVVGASSAALRVHALHVGPLPRLAAAGADGSAAVTLLSDPITVTSRHGARLWLVRARAVTVAAPTGDVRVSQAVLLMGRSGGWSGLLPGQRLTVRGHWSTARPGDDVAAVLFTDAAPVPRGRPPPWQRAAGRVRQALRDACDGLSPAARGLVPGLVVGDVSQLPLSVKEEFRVTGLTHLMAVSGANVAIVLSTVMALSRRTGVGRRLRLLTAAVALAGFVVLARPSPSVLRAAVMGAVVLVAGFAGRRREPVPALAAAVLLLVVVDPFLADDAGFVLSVAATGALVTVAPRWSDRLARRMPRPLAVAIAVPAAAQLACTPVIAAVFGQLTPYAVPANLLAAPAVAPATVLGVVAALVAVWMPGPAHLLVVVAALAADWLAFVAHTLATLPGAGLSWPTGWAGLGELAAAGLGVVAVRRGLRRLTGRGRDAGCRDGRHARLCRCRA